jgi:hypothetical protein
VTPTSVSPWKVSTEHQEHSSSCGPAVCCCKVHLQGSACEGCLCTLCCSAVPPQLLSQQAKADSAVAGPEAEASLGVAGDTENRDATSMLQRVSAAAAGCTRRIQPIYNTAVLKLQHVHGGHILDTTVRCSFATALRLSAASHTSHRHELLSQCSGHTAACCTSSCRTCC